MKKTVMHPEYGKITYEESIWTGKKTLSVNGVVLPKDGKNSYLLAAGQDSTYVTLNGNAVTGASVVIRGQEIVIYPKPTVLDWILSCLPFVLILVWGNNPALCSIVPVAGGAIGGALGAAASIVAMLNMRQKPVGKKLLISLLALLATFGIGALVGYILLIVLIAATM